MDDIARGQVVGVSHLGLGRGLRMPLSGHGLGASRAQLDAGEGVDGVVDAVVQRRPAAGHAGVGGVHDSVHFQGGDVAAPQAQARISRRRGRVGQGRHACLGDEPLQQLVLGREELVRRGPRRPHVHERPEGQPQLIGRGTRQAVMGRISRRGRQSAPMRLALFNQVFHQVLQQFAIHGFASRTTAIARSGRGRAWGR